MDIVEELYRIDSNPKIREIKIGDIEVWPILRFYYAEELMRQGEKSSNRKVKINRRFLIFMLKSLFWGISNLKRLLYADVLVFSAVYRNKQYKGKYIDSIAGGIIDYYKDRVCVVENPSPDGHIKMCKRYNPFVFSESLFFFISFLFAFFCRNKMEIANEVALININTQLGIDVNYKAILLRYLGQYKMMEWLLKYINPQKVYIVSSCSYLGYIRAFKEKGIPVIELQHGLIDANHLYYLPHASFDRKFYPDYFLSFGLYCKKMLSSNFFISKERIYPIGNYFLSKMKEAQIDCYNSLRQKYRVMIAFSAQLPYEEKAIGFLNEVAKADNSILIKYIPRNISRDYSNFNLNNNLQIDKSVNIYDAILSTDLHSTISSTCSLDALALGKQNIIINWNNESRRFYNGILDEKYSCFVDNVNDYVLQTQNIKEVESYILQESVSNFYMANYHENLLRFFQTVFED